MNKTGALGLLGVVPRLRIGYKGGVNAMAAASKAFARLASLPYVIERIVRVIEPALKAEPGALPGADSVVPRAVEDESV